MSTATGSLSTLTSDDFFDPLKEHLIATTGLSYYRSRDGELADRVALRMSKLAITTCRPYLQLLRSGPAGDRELDNLIQDLTIGETFFFRHTTLFKALEQTILPDAIRRNSPHRRLRIWSAGSSIGAEAYTLSILLRRHLAHLIPDWDVTIIGTDINRSYLARAARAQFEDWALRGVDEKIKQQCFSRTEDSWTLRPAFKKGVSFQYHNLASHPFPSLLHNLFAFDVILCRNVMIYFNPAVIETLIANMRQCLVNEGWLLVGHAEHNQNLFRDFRTATFDGAIAYQRAEEPNPATPRGADWISSPAAPEPQPQAAQPTASHNRDTSAAVKGQITTVRSFRLPPTGARRHTASASELGCIRALADRGQLETAEAGCQQLLKTNKLDPICHLYHALILGQLGQHSSCESALRRAIYLDRDCVLAHYYLGLTLRRSGDRNGEAARALRNASHLLAKLDPNKVLDDSDGLTASELGELTRTQLNAIES